MAVRRLREAKRVLLVKGFDELNVIRSMDDLYAGLDDDNRKAFRELYVWRYIEVLRWLRPDHEDTVDMMFAMYMTGLLPKEEWEGEKLPDKIPKRSKLGKKADQYLEQLLSTPNEVTQVAYDAEVYRKRDRAAEAVNATPGKRNKQIEMDRQLKYWSRSTAWYSDIICEDASRQAMRDVGIRMVEWVTQKDEKVCAACRDLNGQRFPINQIPSDPHRNCRCYVRPVRGE